MPRLRALLCGIDHPAAASDDRGGGGDCEQSGLGGHFSPPVEFELSSACELAHPGRARCDGHHRMAGNFRPLSALAVDSKWEDAMSKKLGAAIDAQVDALADLPETRA